MSFSSYRINTMCKGCRSGSSENMECEEDKDEAETSEESRKDEKAIDEGEVHDAL